MDPVTTAIIAAIAVGAISGTTKVAEQSIIDAYEALKFILKKKFGQDNEIIKVVTDLEAKPDSKGRKETLEEEIIQQKADQDKDVLQAANKLVELIKLQPGGMQHMQTAIGNYIAQADRNSTASVNVDQPKSKKA